MMAMLRNSDRSIDIPCVPHLPDRNKRPRLNIAEVGDSGQRISGFGGSGKGPVSPVRGGPRVALAPAPSLTIRTPVLDDPRRNQQWPGAAAAIAAEDPVRRGR